MHLNGDLSCGRGFDIYPVNEKTRGHLFSSLVKGLDWHSDVSKSQSNIWVMRSQMGLSQDQHFRLFMLQHGVAALKCSRGHIFGPSKRSLTPPPRLPIYEPRCTREVGDGDIQMHRDRQSYKERSTDRKCGRLTGRKAWFFIFLFYCTGVIRGSFEMEKAERTRARKRRGRSWVDCLRNENWLTERVSVRKAQWLVGNL